jgi:pyruvate dehydrogenase E2 component (dihydrolipoamide acetyltransferase)
MARSKREIPHYYLASDIDLSRSMTWLDARNAELPVTERLLPVVLLLKATALALHEAPDLHGFWEEGEYRPADGVHVGVAIALRGGGLVAPAISDADSLALAELMVGLRGLVARARSGSLRSSEVSRATLTVTSLGDQGVDVVQPVIYPPQVSIVGFGRIRPRPWAVDGMLGVRPVVTATLAADHRVSDGHRGAVFLTALARLLQEPEGL